MLHKLLHFLTPGRRAYQAAKTTPHYAPPRNANLSPDGAVQDASTHLRAWGRHLDENNDIAVAILNELVDQIVGGGIVVEPKVVDPVTGTPMEAINSVLADVLEEWGERPEVTQQLTWGEVQRITCRAWLRDGDHFTHHVQGFDRGYEFAADQIPYAVELVEADRVPLDFSSDNATPRVLQGVEIDRWHRPVAFHMWKQQPGGNAIRFSEVAVAGFMGDTRRVPAEQMTQIAWRNRFPQVRGVSIFAPVTRRLHDIHDYDESERIAARTYARIAAWIERDPEVFQGTQKPDTERELTIPQGAVLDELLPGEKIGTTSNERPNPNVNTFREGQIRAIAAGSRTRFSAVARNYNGTYSAQRQELVEASHSYAPLTRYFIARIVRGQYARLVETAILSGRLRPPEQLTLRQLLRAEYHGPAIPWIDPKKEAEADILQINNDLATRDQIIRKRGGDPRTVPERQQHERSTTPEPATADEDDEADT